MDPISDDPYYKNILAARSLVVDRSEIHLLQTIFNLRIARTNEPHGLSYENGYCFHIPGLAWHAFYTWDGESEPIGYAKNPFTQKYGDCPCLNCKNLRR